MFCLNQDSWHVNIIYSYCGLAHCLVTLVTTNTKEGTRGIEICSTEYLLIVFKADNGLKLIVSESTIVLSLYVGMVQGVSNSQYIGIGTISR